MKNILYLLLIISFYSCHTKQNVTKIEDRYNQPITIAEKEKVKTIYTEPKPEPTAAISEPNSEPQSIIEISLEPANNTYSSGNNVKRQTTARLAIVSQTIKPFEFIKGDINFVVKDTMILGAMNEVNMTISKNVDINKIISEIKKFNINNLRTDSIRIAPTMKARLVDPSGINFKIVAKTNEEQFIEVGDYTRWIWAVTPLNKGSNSLSMVVDVMYDDKGKTYQVYDGVIYVYSIESFYDKVITFLINNWQYLLSTLLLPLIYALFKKYKSL